jgi:hypothetical protein
MQNPNNQNNAHGKISSSSKCSSKRVVVSRSFLDALVTNNRSSANNSTSAKNQDNYTFVVIANKDKEVAQPTEVKPSVFGAIKTLVITICSKVIKPLCIFIYSKVVSFLIAAITMLTAFINRRTNKEVTSETTNNATSNVTSKTTVSDTPNHENVLTFKSKNTRSKRS